jgi:hypothetical protein
VLLGIGETADPEHIQAKNAGSGLPNRGKALVNRGEF